MSLSPALVIGSNCFTGSHIVDALLERGSDVIGVSRSKEFPPAFLPYRRHHKTRFEFHQIDLTQQFEALRALLDAHKPPVVIHVAALSEVALSNERPVEYYETNTVAVARLTDHLRRARWLKRYVHISSAEVYGHCDHPVTEAAPFLPSTPYAVSKASADLHLATLANNFGFPALLIRSTNVYGRHQQLFKIIPRTVIRLRQGERIELHGGGTAKKSFIHIRDVVAGLVRALDHGEPGTYHFSVSSDQTVADVVRTVCERMGRDFEESVVPVGERLGQDGRYWLDCAKARRVLGWEPKIAFEDGVDEVVEWIDSRWNELIAEPLVYQHR